VTDHGRILSGGKRAGTAAPAKQEHLGTLGAPLSERPDDPVFYPRGYVSVCFESQADAEEVRRLLLDGGYDEKDVHVMDRATVPGRRPGAADGNAFLLAYAPSELETERLMDLARRVGFTKAHRYDRFKIIEL
jgi:hypothetical protein